MPVRQKVSKTKSEKNSAAVRAMRHSLGQTVTDTPSDRQSMRRTVSKSENLSDRQSASQTVK